MIGISHSFSIFIYTNNEFQLVFGNVPAINLFHKILSHTPRNNPKKIVFTFKFSQHIHIDMRIIFFMVTRFI